MTYISPLHIIKGIADGDDFKINDVNLIRLRKRLLAELNLSGETTITLNQKSYSKDEIIKTIDQLLDNPELELHEFIYTHEFLLKYLEDETLSMNPQLYIKLEADNGIKQKLANLTYERFLIQFKKGISTRSFTQTQNAIILITNLPENLREYCYEEIHNSLSTLHTFLYELEHSLTIEHKEEIKFLGYAAFGDFLNALPEEFEDVKYDLVNRTINIVVAYHNLKKHDKDLVSGISSVLIKVQCVDEQSKLIKNNHKVFNGKESSSFNYSFVRYIGIAAIVIVNVFKNCGNDTNTHVSNMSTFQEYSSPSINSVNDGSTTDFDFELRRYRAEVTDRIINIEHFNYNAMFDTIKEAKITEPFMTAFKLKDDTILGSWKESIQINNNTKYDLIVISYDSTQTNVCTNYIKQSDQSKLKFKDHTRFVFYFGNTLLRPSPMINGSFGNTDLHEYFAETPSSAIDILNSNYEITLNQPKLKKKKKNPTYILNLEPEFLATAKDLHSFDKFDLKKIYN